MRSSKLRKGRGPCVRLRLYLRLELGRGKKKGQNCGWSGATKALSKKGIDRENFAVSKRL